MAYSVYLDSTIVALQEMKSKSEIIDAALSLIINSISSGGTLFFCGNGGSAADSQHWAAELMGEFRMKGKPMRALALTVDTSIITSIANDSEYKNVFARQLEGLGKKGDVLFAISTSGNSRSVNQAALEAKKMGISVIAVTGKGGGELAQYADILINAPGESTEVIQHVHVTIGHYLLGALEESQREKG